MYSAYHIQMTSLCARGIITLALAPHAAFQRLEHSKEYIPAGYPFYLFIYLFISNIYTG